MTTANGVSWYEKERRRKKLNYSFSAFCQQHSSFFTEKLMLFNTNECWGETKRGKPQNVVEPPGIYFFPSIPGFFFFFFDSKLLLFAFQNWFMWSMGEKSIYKIKKKVFFFLIHKTMWWTKQKTKHRFLQHEESISNGWMRTKKRENSIINYL